MSTHDLTKKILVANWKSNKTANEAKEWLEEYARTVGVVPPNKNVIICPPFSLLGVAAEIVKSKNLFVSVGAQNISSFDSGAYTGEVCGRNLAGLCSYVIVGHSERRQYLHETSQDIANKVLQCTEYGLVPILCVDKHEFTAQAAAMDKKPENLIVAYEPREYIGSGVPEPLEEAKFVLAELRNTFPGCPILYGGSVQEKNVDIYVKDELFDGALVGTDSLDVAKFIAIVKKV
jgi:triosephosphate isomerase